MRCLAALLLPLTACTVVSTAQVPSGRGARDVFVTTGDIQQPYDSMGPIQATRKGALAFGFFDPAGTDLDAGMTDFLNELRRMGADGAINVHYNQTQYLTATRAIFAVLFFIPLPTQCVLTGEAVKLHSSTPPPPGTGL